MNIEIMRNTLYKAYLDDFAQFSAKLGGATSEIMSDLLSFEVCAHAGVQTSALTLWCPIHQPPELHADTHLVKPLSDCWHACTVACNAAVLHMHGTTAPTGVPDRFAFYAMQVSWSSARLSVVVHFLQRSHRAGNSVHGCACRRIDELSTSP